MYTHKPYLDLIHNECSAMTALTEKWALINSWSHNLSGLQSMLAVLKDDFKILNAPQTTLSFPSKKTVGNKGQLIETGFGKALLIKKRPEAPVQILLSGHMDTVYPPGESDPIVVIEKEVIRGPGVADMKGGLVVLLKAVETLERSPHAQRVGWEIFINADEEIGSPGSEQFFTEAAKRHCLGLVFEPSLPDGSFIDRRKGTANLTLVVRGRAAHSGRDFYSGRSAIYAIADLIRQIEYLSDQKKDVTVNIGYLEGGGPVNIVPDLALCKINVRTREPEDMVDVREKIDQIIFSQVDREGISLSLREDSARPPKPFDDKTQQLFQLYKGCAKQLNIPFQTRSSGGACDGNILAAAGLPTIDSLGVVGDKIHTSDEYLLSKSLVQRAQLSGLFLLELASGHFNMNKEPT
jgi:glutamate carboxypeptidase